MAFDDPIQIDLQFISDETSPPNQEPGGMPEAPPGNHSEVFGIAIAKWFDLETVIDTDVPNQAPPPPAQWVYGVQIDNLLARTVNLGFYDGGDLLPFGLDVFQRRPTTFFRVQIDGGGRQVMYAAYGDDSPRRFFEMWKDGVRFSFLGLPDPVVQLRSPSGIITNRPVYMRGRAYGRFGVDLGELNEIGDWKMQIRFVEESDSLGASVDLSPAPPDVPPRPPPEPVGELWRALHTPLILRVCRGSEDIW